jgi:hypothetical protein
MAEGEVHPSTDTSQEVGKKGKGGTFAKYKWWIIGGGIAIILLLLYFMHSSSSGTSSQNAANQAATQAQSDIDPETGYEYGSAADLAALGAASSGAGTPGPAGAAGPAGATGPAGPTGATGAAGSGPAWTTAQEQKAWAKGRSKNELGSLFIGGKWYKGVPKPPAPAKK